MNLIRWTLGRVVQRRSSRPDVRLRISNLTRQVELAHCVDVADHGAKRRKGLLGREMLSAGEGLWIVPCESVHTFGMQFPIDLVYLDGDKRVKKVRNDVPPWRISACLSAYSVLELASGSIRRTGTKPGDKLEFSSVPLPGDRPQDPDATGRTLPEAEGTTSRRGAAINRSSGSDGWRGEAMQGVLTARSFHLRMAYLCAAILCISFTGCRLTSVQITWGELMIALFVALAFVLPLPLYWYEKQRADMREAAMTIPWALVLAVILPSLVPLAARANMPLQDAHFARLDQLLGISVPGIMTWAAHHWLGSVINRSYPLLIPLLPIAIFAPALTGKWRDARAFVVANMAAFAIGLPLFALLPAVGPWYGFHLIAGPDQIHSQSELFLARVPGPYIFHPAGIVCFPSFHVIWAIFWARGLWGFKVLRIPVTVLSGVIILSTMTTGWHYFSDVFAGAIVAALSIALAESWNGSSDLRWPFRAESDSVTDSALSLADTSA